MCSILAKYTNDIKTYHMGTVQKHYEMNAWLQNNGRKELIYELHKGTNIHSVWIWKEKTERWGRTATPSSKPEKDTLPQPLHVDKKKLRQDKAKIQSNSGRQPRS